MKTKQKSRLAILLAALLASSALASCGDSGTPAVTTSATDNTKADTTTDAETGPVYKKPDKDFSGRNLNLRPVPSTRSRTRTSQVGISTS